MLDDLSHRSNHGISGKVQSLQTALQAGIRSALRNRHREVNRSGREMIVRLSPSRVLFGSFGLILFDEDSARPGVLSPSGRQDARRLRGRLDVAS